MDEKGANNGGVEKRYRVALIGFDSAWTDSKRAPGALSALLLGGSNQPLFVAPELVSFDGAAARIDDLSTKADVTLIAIDQPTIVPNLTGGRPVERVAASVITFVGGGVQPASRKREGMFNDDAPIWRFKARVDAIEAPSASRTAESGRFLMEVFPALALIGFNPAFFKSKGVPRYNPARRHRFKRDDWSAVVLTLRHLAMNNRLDDLVDWLDDQVCLAKPTKADQDRLDAVVCVLIAWHWRFAPREQTIVIGDIASGYMVAPVSIETRERLVLAATMRGVPIDQF